MKRTWDDMFSEILQTSAASDYAQRASRVDIADCVEEERADRRKTQASQQEKEREMHQDIMGLFQPQMQILQTLVDLPVHQPGAHIPSQSMENSSITLPYTLPPTIPHGTRELHLYPDHSTAGDYHSFTYTDVRVAKMDMTVPSPLRSVPYIN
ncbi:unnamed protein product [Caretta caretta]